MSAIDTLREYAEVWHLFGNMPDDATLSAEVSALYLGVSVKTLARYRQNGNGPAYIQYQAEDSKARNQRVNYLLGDLRAWRDSHKVSSTMEAAQVRGLAFTCLNDFTKPEPFWSIDNKIYSHALTISDEIFKELLNTTRAEVIWISVEKVLSEDWHSARERQIWNDFFVIFLNELVLTSNLLQEKHIINDKLLE
ncbi:hypothetical protein FMK67_07020 [Klebsiella michiganensis]|uniref:hypothetical protein n=1 Tax=Enterobacteriaceae TaxID=543 RepID=UPI000516B4E7|nr:MULTISPECIES: hypothetical protein [Klebsiella]AUV97016.1 hypothetical protein C2U46_04720 [Klebsiella oxytoca]AOV13774.1 hypothetical protein BJF97_23215 [Klebsiella sp. LTGPAF-6F]MBD0963388.1 hypothetical protein [Klebsiella michiganensis]MBG2569495.1 hypothetical protein [Klebsiella sp. LTGPAF-6F]MBZ6664591.1 hypothetical protein [Klebsiella michiganensis]